MTRSATRTWPGKDVPGRRLFVAVPLPADTIEAVSALVETVRAPGVPGGGRDVRWVRLDGLHLTIRFLGPTPDGLVDPTLAAVRDVAPAVAPFDITIGGGGAFPSPARPRAIWLGIIDGMRDLGAVATAMDGALVAAGWQPETRPFRAHLTLARSDGVAAGPAVAGRLMDAARELRLTARIDGIGLFESHTGDGPARYEPLELVPLG